MFGKIGRTLMKINTKYKQHKQFLILTFKMQCEPFHDILSHVNKP